VYAALKEADLRTGCHYYSSFITTGRFTTAFDDITTEEADLRTNADATFV
jgi:hypothetical protein